MNCTPEVRVIANSRSHEKSLSKHGCEKQVVSQ